MNVRNMLSQNGNCVPNQFIITTDEGGQFFQSYNTVIAFKHPCGQRIELDAESWDYSTTTGKYRNLFLGEKIAETRKKIKDGTYNLVNLN